ncbi:CGNR zinc finger domain-containing protein [Paraburkholderia oxyphila]|uniref:CGNR zinc finger domain-containing protein n=1 Tax=Paraburkholderia oxyphila TaxID=614212 RepID=UPI0012EE3E0B
MGFYRGPIAHCRRWCRVAICGNRHTIANFAARKRHGGKSDGAASCVLSDPAPAHSELHVPYHTRDTVWRT